MTRTEALATIKAEWAIYQTPDGWVVANTDERAVQGAIQTFTDEDSALDLFVRRLRLYK